MLAKVEAGEERSLCRNTGELCSMLLTGTNEGSEIDVDGQIGFPGSGKWIVRDRVFAVGTERALEPVV